MYLAWRRLEVDADLHALRWPKPQSPFPSSCLDGSNGTRTHRTAWRLLDENRSVRGLRRREVWSRHLSRLILSHASGAMTNNGDCGFWSRQPSSSGSISRLRRNQMPRGIRRRLNATARRVKATDYVGRVRRRLGLTDRPYRSHRLCRTS